MFRKSENHVMSYAQVKEVLRGTEGLSEGLLAGMDAAIVRARAAISRHQRGLVAIGQHNFQVEQGHATGDLPRCAKCLCKHRVLADRPKRRNALKRECDLGESKHQQNIDPTNPQFCTQGQYKTHWICWCSHLRDGITCTMSCHLNAVAYTARKA